MGGAQKLFYCCSVFLYKRRRVDKQNGAAFFVTLHHFILLFSPTFTFFDKLGSRRG